MNNLISFWLAPITAFFHPKVYRDAAHKPGSRGVLYALYFSGVVTFLIMVMMMSVLMPSVDKFAEWLKKEMPVLIWTPDGLSMEPDVKQPYILAHPVYGTVAIFDMDRSAVTEKAMGKAYVVVTAQKIFFRKTLGQIEERDITQKTLQAQPRSQRMPSKVRITGEVVGQVYQNIKRMLLFLIPIVFLALFFLFFLMSALFYSLVGLLMNRLRKHKLGYGAVFNLTSFALTASFIVGWLVRGLSASWILTTVINLGYMFFAFKVTDREAAKV